MAATRIARKKDLQPGNAIEYRVLPHRPEAHLFLVECRVPDPNPAGECFALPAWIPGSYLIRDFARHVVSFKAVSGKRMLRPAKAAIDQWRVVPPKGAQSLTVIIEVYAWDLSVRGAHLDPTHAFFNGSSLFLRVIGRERTACRVELVAPTAVRYAGWRVATAMPRAGATVLNDFGSYQAANYAELIDHPVEMGRFDAVDFTVRGVRHDFALTGVHAADLDRLRRDLRRICAWQIDFWGAPRPVARYVFLTTCVGDGYGGLEHRASTALLCKRDDLPRPGDKAIGEGYRNFLALASHEYFHTWLVKRIRPADLAGPDGHDLQAANPTELLWLFEGFTAYYDELALLRCGLISADDYLACLAKIIASVMGIPGRFRQSVAEASFDAWIKFYKPDENTPNSTISYYAKGALVALALDLTIRDASAGQRSLDDLMRRLWQEFGSGEPGVREDDIRRLAGDLAPTLPRKTLAAFFANALHGTADLPIARLLATHGIELAFEGTGQPSLGIRLDPLAGEPKIACAYEGGAAQAAGLSGNDVLIAINGLKATPANLDRLVGQHKVGDTIEVHAFRRDELKHFAVKLLPAAPTRCRLSIAAKAGKRALALRSGYLQGA